MRAEQRAAQYFLFSFFYHLLLVCTVLLFFVCFYFFSLTLNCYLQMLRVGKYSNEQVLFVSQKSGNYQFQRNIDMTYERLKFQTYAGRIYLYINKKYINEDHLRNLTVGISRDCYGLLNSYRYTSENLESASAHFQEHGYYAFTLPPLAMYPSYNHIKISLSGVKFLNPNSDVKIFLFFNGHKGQTIFLSYLIKSAKYFVVALFFAVGCLAMKRYKKKFQVS